MYAYMDTDTHNRTQMPTMRMCDSSNNVFSYTRKEKA